MKRFDSIWFFFILVMIAASPGAAAAATQDDAEETASTLFAIVALRAGCDEPALTWSGSGMEIAGAVHANGGIEVSGSGLTATGPVTSPCPADVSGSSIELGDGVVEAEPIASPVQFDPDTIACDYELPDGDLEDDGPWWEGGESTSRRLRDGVYCAVGDIILSGSSVSGSVTLIAKGEGARVRLGGSSMALEPYAGGVLAWSGGTGDDAIEIEGSSGSWSGDILAPNGGVTVDQSGGEFSGTLIVGQMVHLSGSGWSLTGRPVDVPASTATGSIAVHAYECPFAAGEQRKDLNWFDICLPGPEGVVFELTPTNGDDLQSAATDSGGEVTFAGLPEGTYGLLAENARWCRATSDSVNARGEVEVQPGEEANVWIFFCDAG